jgi:hypothetical protein
MMRSVTVPLYFGSNLKVSVKIDSSANSSPTKTWAAAERHRNVRSHAYSNQRTVSMTTDKWFILK